jgi:hypothetical protein
MNRHILPSRVIAAEPIARRQMEGGASAPPHPHFNMRRPLSETFVLHTFAAEQSQSALRQDLSLTLVAS